MRDMAQEQQMGRNIASLGKVARDLSMVWQAAEDATQTLDRQNHIDEGQREIYNRAQTEPDYKNSDQYFADLDALKDSSLEGFSNNEARAKFAITANNQTAAAKIKMDGLFRTKMQDHYKGELITSHDKNKRDYIATGDPMYMEKQKGEALKALEVGAVNEVFVANEGVKVDDWQQLRYLQMAQNGEIREALKLIDESDMQPSEKNAAKASIMTMARQGAIIAEVEQINREQEMYAQSDAFIDDPNKSYVEKLDFLEQQEKFGLTAADKKELVANLTSANKVAAESHSEAKATILLSIDKLDKGITQKKDNYKDIKEYLKGVKATRSLITNKQTEGVITSADKKALLDHLNKTVKEEKNIATNKISKQDGFLGIGYGYKDAYKDFNDAFGGVPGLADEALIELFETSEVNKLKDAGQKQEVLSIIDRYNERLRKETIERINQAAGFTPKAVDTTIPVEEVLKQHNATMADVEAAAKKYNVSTDEVIKRMRQ
jgi:hypothetical protein